MNPLKILRPAAGILAGVLMMAVGTHRAIGQVLPDDTSGVSLHGSTMLSAESRQESGYDPALLAHGDLRGVLSLGAAVSMPFEIYGVAHSAASPYADGVNGFSVDPELFGWITLHGGNCTVGRSRLALNATRLTGGAIELHPGSFRAAAFAGTLRSAAAPDTANGFDGWYRRTAVGGWIGYDDDHGAQFTATFTRVADDSTSLSSAPANAWPTENAFTSVGFAVPIADRIVRLNGEAAISAFTHDAASAGIDGGEIEPLYTARTSTSFDGAAVLGLVIEPIERVSLGIDARWIGPGYITLTDPYRERDLFEITATPSAALLDGDLTLSGTAGTRTDNLLAQRSATTRRTYGTLTAIAQCSRSFGFVASLAHYASRIRAAESASDRADVLQSVMLTPRYMIEDGDMLHTITATYAGNRTAQVGRAAAYNSDGWSQSGSLAWACVTPSAWSVAASVTHTAQHIGSIVGTLSAVGASLGYDFADHVAGATLALEYAHDRLLIEEDHLRATLTATATPAPIGCITLGVHADFSLSTPAAGLNALRGTLTWQTEF